MRKRIHLNFNWFFKLQFNKEDTIDYKNHINYEEVMLPHTNKILPLNYLPGDINNIISTYKKEIFIDNEYYGKVLELVFEAVAHKASIFMNGLHLMDHEGGYTEFRVDISDSVVYGETNYLTVIVDNNEYPEIPPFGGMVDYLGFGGIYREVHLEVSNKLRFLEVYLKTGDINQNQIIGKVLTSIKTGFVQIFVYDDMDNEVYYNIYQVEDYVTKFKCHVPEKRNWTIDDPYLYKVTLKFIKEDLRDTEVDNLMDEYRLVFGFRTVEFREDGFYLNDKLVLLRGLNRHQDYPYVGYAMPKSAQVMDADILKYELGLNIVRTSHYPQSRHFLDRCDEIGLLVFEEIPGWQYIGNEKFKENTFKNIESMIKRDYHHPSIIMWGVRINESNDDHDFYIKTNELARLIDDSRPTGGVRNFIDSEMFEDVYTFNDFLHDGSKHVLRDVDTVKKGVPYLVTEYNGHMFPAKKTDGEVLLVEHAMRHYRVIDKASSMANLSGTIGWCMHDYYTHDYFGSGDNTCYHGVMDSFRLAKPASYIYQSQKDDGAVLEVLSSIKSGDYPMGVLDTVYVATNLDYIKLYKDDSFIGDFHPDKSSKLNHPIIEIDDFIGNQLVENHNIILKDSDKIKQLFKAVTKYGTNLSVSQKLVFSKILKKYNLSLEDAMAIYYRYINMPAKYRFVGYKNNIAIKEVVKGIAKSTHFEVKVDNLELIIGDTYDVTRVVVSKKDQDNNLLIYDMDAILVDVIGGIELIGPRFLSLRSGEAAFWVKTKKQAENGIVKIHTEKEEFELEIKVREK